MPLLPPNAIAFQYQSGLDRIREAFQAAIATLERTRNDATEAYWRYVDSGEDDSEYDDDGCLTHSTAFQLRHAEYEADYALRAVREAFITSAFHYWERWARAVTGLKGPNDNFEELRESSAQHYPVNDGLKAINYLNNVIKHSSAYNARQLASIRSDHFWRTPMSYIHNRQEHWALGIADRHVEEVFDIVSASGPQYVKAPLPINEHGSAAAS